MSSRWPSFQNLPPEIKRAARAKFALFSRERRHPSLNIHKLQGVVWHGHQVFDLYVTDRYRVLFFIDRDVIVCFSIGPQLSRVESKPATLR